MNNSLLTTLCLVALATISSSTATEIHISPSGDDENPGTPDKPLANFGAAQLAARKSAGRELVTIHVHDGIYYLPKTLRFGPKDSGTAESPIRYVAAKGANPVLSGGSKLELRWEPYRDGILQARTPEGLAIDQVFIDGDRQPMARYPNFDPEARPYNGAAADAFSKERAARWKNPAGGFIHAMHRAHWGGYHYLITGKNKNGEVTYEGGWQNNRQMGMHARDRFVENIFEELDAPGEWFHDAKSATLYYLPPADVDPAKATVEVVRLRHLVEFNGTKDRPVRHITLQGFTFRHAARTFMDVKEPLLRSDWTIYRGGAVRFEGAEDCSIVDCELDQLGGNGIFVNNYNRRITIRGCDIHDTGASAIAFIGDPKAVRNPLFEYRQRQDYADIDRTPGPQTDNFPAECLVDDCLLRRFGQVEKQATGVQVSMSQSITIRHCSIYEASRAGINISEGTFSGHVIEHCDVFDTVRETGDHGSFNSWGRDRFWKLNHAPKEELPDLALLDAAKPSIIRNSRWRCDHGWDVDLDDGSTNYHIYNNLFLNGGLKLREGFHRRVWNNIAVNNSLHPHVWFDNSQDVVTGNIFMGAYRPAGGMPKGKWGKELDRNLFTDESDRTKFAAHGCDANSIVGDPMFVDPENGDFRVKDGSPALKLGFVNFPMDQFGVKKPALRAIARTPDIPEIGKDTRKPTRGKAPAPALAYWLQARVRDLGKDEFSAFGVAKESGGIVIEMAPAASTATKCGFKDQDLIQLINGKAVRNISDLLKQQDAAAGKPLMVGVVRSQQEKKIKVESYPTAGSESAAASSFSKFALSTGKDLVRIKSVTTRPDTANESAGVLRDGELAQNYGPVHRNGVHNGLYKADLGKVVDVASIGTWSFNQNGSRGSQHFTVFGSSSDTDPGWNLGQGKDFVPIATVHSRCNGKFHATRIQSNDGSSLGSYRWLLWAVSPVTGKNENTAYQEFQVQTTGRNP